MTFETIFWIGLAIMAGLAAFMVWLVFYVTRAPKCGTVHGHDKECCSKAGEEP